MECQPQYSARRGAVYVLFSVALEVTFCSLLKVSKNKFFWQTKSEFILCGSGTARLLLKISVGKPIYITQGVSQLREIAICCFVGMNKSPQLQLLSQFCAIVALSICCKERQSDHKEKFTMPHLTTLRILLASNVI